VNIRPTENSRHTSAIIIESRKPSYDWINAAGAREAFSHFFASSQVPNVLSAFFLVALVVAIYLPILPGSFIMDDARLVGKAANPLVSGELTFRTVWFGTDFPLTLCVWWAEWSTWGNHACGYHAVNILLQALSAVLLWRILLRLNVRGAWLAAAIFAVHPVCVGSVARIAELKNTLSLPFFLLSFWAYLRYEACSLYRTQDKPADARNLEATLWFSLSFVGFILALFSKTTTIALPVTLLFAAAWQRGRFTGRDFVHVIPFFVIALWFGLMSVWFQKYQALAGQGIISQTFVERLGVAARNFWFYCGKAVLPVNLTIFYSRWKTDASALAALWPAILAALVFLVCWRSRRGWGRPALFGLGCFTVLLFPALGFFDAQCFTKFQVSDHLQYLPLIALVSLIGGTIGSLPNKWVLRGAAVIVLSTLSILGFQRAEVFSTEESLLRDTLSKNAMAWPAHNDLGVILARQGRLPDATEHFEAALKSNPNDPDLLANLALTHFVQGRFNEACAAYRAAIRMKPDSPSLHENLANALKNLGKNDEAIAHLDIALRDAPKIETRLSLAGLLYSNQNFRRAVDEYHKVLLAEPDNVSGLNNLAFVLTVCPDKSIRNGGEAIKFSKRACELTGFRQAPFIKTLSAAFSEQNRLSEAAAADEMASRLQVAMSEPDSLPGKSVEE
jgi:protein O-mannosyl-transferase